MNITVLQFLLKNQMVDPDGIVDCGRPGFFSRVTVICIKFTKVKCSCECRVKEWGAIKDNI